MKMNNDEESIKQAKTFMQNEVLETKQNKKHNHRQEATVPRGGFILYTRLLKYLAHNSQRCVKAVSKNAVIKTYSKILNIHVHPQHLVRLVQNPPSETPRLC